MHTAWDACLASVGDGMVGILSLKGGGSCQRMLPGHPAGALLKLQWASSLGFLACMSSPGGKGGEGGPVTIVWDLHSGEIS